MTNYARPLARDVGGAAMQEFQVPSSTLAVRARDNASTSSVINMTANTTIIEVAAVTTPAVIRWVSSVTAFGAGSSVISAAGTANFDHVIGTEEVRRFVVPIEKVAPGLGAASVAGVQEMNGLYQRVAFKSTGIGSVLLTEY